MSKDTKNKITLAHLSVCTAFVLEGCERTHPLVTSSTISDKPKTVLCEDIENYKQLYVPEDLIVLPITEFTFEEMYGHPYWLHSDNHNTRVASIAFSESGKIISFSVNIGKIVTVVVPAFAKCVFIN